MAKRDNLKQYMLYLSKEYDKRLIAHIDSFIAAKRANQEMRRLLYIGLDSGQSRLNGNGYNAPFLDLTDILEIDQEPTGPIDVRSKLKKTFG